MKFIKAHIDGFGGLENRDFFFDDGADSFLEQNGYGKSTLGLFIAAMFYGFWDEKLKKKTNGLRDSARPAGGGKFGGYLDFEWKNARYRLLREWGSKPSEDLLRVMDGESLLFTENLGENPGRTVFGVDAGSFLNTLFVSESDLETKVSDPMNAKLGNVTMDSGDVAQFEAADLRLKDELNRLSPTRETGLIQRHSRRIAELNLRLGQLKTLNEREEARVRREKELTDEIEALREKQGAVSEKIKRLSDYANYAETETRRKTLIETEKERQEALEKAASCFTRYVPEKEDIVDAENRLSETEKQEAVSESLRLTPRELQKLKDVEETFSESVLFPEDGTEIRKKLRDYTEASGKVREALNLESTLLDEEAREKEELSSGEKGRKAGGLGMLISGIVLGGLGALLYFTGALEKYGFGPFIAVALPILGVLLIFAGILLLFKSRKKPSAEVLPVTETLRKATTEREKAEGIRNELTEELKAFFARFHMEFIPETAEYNLADLVEDYEDLEALREKARKEKAAREIAKAEKEKVSAFLSELGFRVEEGDLRTTLGMLKNRYDVYEDAFREYTRAKKFRKDFEETTPADTEKRIKPDFSEGTAELEKSYTELSGRLTEAEKEKLTLRHERETDEREREELSECERERDRLLAERETLLDRYGKLKTAKDLLNQAKQNFTERYRNPVENGFRSYLREIIGDECESLRLGTDGSIQVEKGGELHAPDFLSHGYRDLCYFALRLALTEALYETESMPLVLDDPFVNLDNEKLAKAMNLVKKAGEKHQILYFTCHNSRALKP